MSERDPLIRQSCQISGLLSETGFTPACAGFALSIIQNQTLTEAQIISLNKDMLVIPGCAGVSSSKPIHAPSVLTVEEWTFDPGVKFNAHAHAQSQIVYIFAGKFRMKLGEDEVTLEPGCYYYTPAGTVHEITEIVEKTTMLIVINPDK